METPNAERGLGVDVPIPPTPLEGQEAIEERMVEVGVEDGRGLELIGQELVIHSATQPTDPINLEGLQVQSAAAVTALVTPVRPSRISPSASTMAVEVMDGVGLGGSHQRFPTGPPVSYGPVVGSQGGQDTTPCSPKISFVDYMIFNNKPPTSTKSEVVKELGMVRSKDRRFCPLKVWRRILFRLSGQVERWQVQAELKQLRWICHFFRGIGTSCLRSQEEWKNATSDFVMRIGFGWMRMKGCEQKMRPGGFD